MAALGSYASRARSKEEDVLMARGMATTSDAARPCRYFVRGSKEWRGLQSARRAAVPLRRVHPPTRASELPPVGSTTRRSLGTTDARADRPVQPAPVFREPDPAVVQTPIPRVCPAAPQAACRVPAQARPPRCCRRSARLASETSRRSRSRTTTPPFPSRVVGVSSGVMLPEFSLLDKQAHPLTSMQLIRVII